MIRSRRVHLGVVVALVSVTTLALAPSAVAVPACPSFDDAKGDATPQPFGRAVPNSPELRDPSLDITNVGYSVAGGRFRVAMTLAQHADRPTLAWGHAFQSSFVTHGREVMFTYANSPSREVESVYMKYAWIAIDGRYVEGSNRALQGTVDGNVVTLSFPVAFVESYLGHLSGREVVVKESRTYGTLPGPYGNTYDVAKPDAGFVFTVAPCA